MSLKIFSYKVENSDPTVEKLSRYHLNQAIKAKMTSNRHIDIMFPDIMMQREEHAITPGLFLPKNTKPQSSFKKTANSN